MMNLIKSLFAPKVGVRLIVRANVSPESARVMQNIVQSSGLPGSMRIVPGSLAQIELEGRQNKLQALIAQLQQARLFAGRAVMEMGWRPYTGVFTRFSVSA